MSDKSESTAVLVDNMEMANETSPPRNGKSRNSSAAKASHGSPAVNDNAEDADNLSLPPALRRRVNALRKLQLESINIEKEFFRKVHELECEFAERMAPLNEKRKQIVNGLYEPTDEECEFSVPFDEEYLASELQNQEAIKNDMPDAKKDYYEKGVEEFWLTALRNSECAALTIEYPQDELILKHLTDIEVKMSKDPMKFTLYFHFSPNEYFTNSVLTKEYTMKCEPCTDDPFCFEGPEIESSKGCKIDWKEGKDVTMKKVSKVQVHKKKGDRRIVSKVIKADSFFNFFDPPVVPEGDQDDTMDEKLRSEFEVDAEVGQFFRNSLIPRAVLYYTGECRFDEDEYDEDEEDEDEEYEDDSDDEDEDDEKDEERGDSKAKK